MRLEAKHRLRASAVTLGKPSTKGRRNECFANALKECKSRPGSTYVVGRVKFILKGDKSESEHAVTHAWCQVGDVVYDSTPVGNGELIMDCGVKVVYEPWANYDWSTLKSLDTFPKGAFVTKVFQAAKKTAWYKSIDWKSIPPEVRKA